MCKQTHGESTGERKFIPMLYVDSTVLHTLVDTVDMVINAMPRVNFSDTQNLHPGWYS